MQKSRAKGRRGETQLDLPLVLDSPLVRGVRSDRYLLEFPFFDLSKNAKRKRLSFSEGPVSIEVKAIEGQGVATIYDRDVILYVASLMVQKLEAGEETPSRDFTFSARDFCRISGRVNGGESYDRLMETIERLKGTLIKTNIETGGRGVSGFFNWLDGGSGLSYEVDPKTKRRRLSHIRVVLCEWLWRAIMRDRNILAVHEDYFTLKPVARRIYDLARVHCGDDQIWITTLGQLHRKVGSDMTVRNFKLELAKQIDSVPDYQIEITDDFEAGDGPANKRRLTAQQIVHVSPKSLSIIHHVHRSGDEADPTDISGTGEVAM